jgi:hypothetical protein
MPGPSEEQHDEVCEFSKIMLEALSLYLGRNPRRLGVWRRSGLRGQTQNLFAKAERAFVQAMSEEIPDEDHYFDAIVYSVFALLLLRNHQTRNELLNGTWPWPALNQS